MNAEESQTDLFVGRSEVNIGSSFEQTWYASSWHSFIPSFKISMFLGSGEDDFLCFFFFFFNHTWVCPQSWSADREHLNKLSFPKPQEANMKYGHNRPGVIEQKSLENANSCDLETKVKIHHLSLTLVYFNSLG